MSNVSKEMLQQQVLAPTHCQIVMYVVIASVIQCDMLF